MTPTPHSKLSDAEYDAKLEIATRILEGIAVRNCDIGALTTYRVGGPAALFVKIDREDHLERVVKAVGASDIEVLVIGRGSNLVIADTGFRGLCIMLGTSFESIDIDLNNRVVTAGAGAAFPQVGRQSAASGLCGLEWSVGIPGTVGGAVAMNAGGHGAQTADRLVSAEVVDLLQGKSRQLSASELEFGYRKSKVRSCDLVVGAKFQCENGDREVLADTIARIVSWRRLNQPGGRNAGSVFVNPSGYSAGWLIEQAGMKGYRIGSASVSEKHANFIQADANGSADDVVRLVSAVRSKVVEVMGIELDVELRLIGFAADGL